MRIGHGYDVHRLVVDRDLILGGVAISHTMGLLGHSDADVLTHALVDALMGAAALGDIGSHFPDTDPQWKGVRSMLLLEKTMELIHEKGYRVSNADMTILAQKPKLKPYISDMRASIAACMGLPVDRISIKATTEEGLGFTGREEGIAAHAVVLLEEN